MKRPPCTRRTFLHWTSGLLLGACSGQMRGNPDPPKPLDAGAEPDIGPSAEAGASPFDAGHDAAAEAAAPDAGPTNPVSLVRCTSYDLETVATAMREALDLLGGIEKLVKGKTVAVKLNLTGGQHQVLFDRPPGETYMTHESTALALAALLFEAGARRVRFVEGIPARATLEEVMSQLGWDVPRLAALGDVSFDNTRNLGGYSSYASVRAPSGLLYSHFEVNRAYVETDVLVSLAKLKEHKTAGVTLATKNLFGVTPFSLYSDDAAQGLGEESLGYRGPMHDRALGPGLELPGELPGFEDRGESYRVARITADLCAAFPLQLSLIDGVRTVTGGEGPWHSTLAPLDANVLVAGLNPISTDAIGSALLGYDASAESFETGDNHLYLAAKAGLGTTDLARIDGRGATVEDILGG